MSDLPEQVLLQQLHARPTSGEALELLGKKAAASWRCGESDTLSTAVVETVKHAHLSPEQVRRVIEFANTDAFLQEFKKEGHPHRVVNFQGGPADPSAVLQDLNDGGGGTVFDDGSLDYTAAPHKEKSASADDEAFFKQAFAVEDRPEGTLNPLSEVEDLRFKLASAEEGFTSQLVGLESAIDDLSNDVYQQVKQATLSGTSLGSVVQALHTVGTEPEYVKIAFAYLADRLTKDGVFSSPEELTNSITKTAGNRVVNTNHPLLQDFSELFGCIEKAAEVRAARQEVVQVKAELDAFLTKQAAGVIPTILNGAKWLGEKSRGPVGALVKGITGNASHGEAAAGAADFLLRKSPHIAAGIGAHELYRHLKYNPTYNKMVGMTNPLSDAYAMREAQIAGSYGQYPEP